MIKKRTSSPDDVKENSQDKFQVDGDSVVKINSRREARALAFQLLYAADRQDYSVPLEQIIQQFSSGFNLEIPADSLAVQITQGVIQTQKELDLQINPLLENWKITRLGCCTLLVLRIALWELRQPDAIPTVIINEAIELAKCFAEKDAYKFVNGILDEYCKKMGLSDERMGKDDGKNEL